MAAAVRAPVGAVALSVLLALSCGRRPQTGPVSELGSTAPPVGPSTAPPVGPSVGPSIMGEKGEDEVSAKRPDTEGGDDALARAIDRRICRKRGCCVSGIEAAGEDRKGRSLVVATIDAGYGGVASCLVTPPNEPKPFGSGVLDKEPSPLKPPAEAEATPEESSDERDDEAGDDSGPAEHDPEAEECRPYEHHLIVHTHGKIRARQLLTESCNNGYGAAGVGEDATSVDEKERTFTHSRGGGSAWRGTTSVTVGLDPLRIVGEGNSSFWTMDEEGTSKSVDWNYDTFQGTESWSIPDCEGRRKREEAIKHPDAGVDPEQLNTSNSFEALSVPRVQLPAAFLQVGWRSIGLGNCGALVDGDEHGYAVHGGKGKATDAAMRVVISTDGVLFVEISDDRWTAQGRTWVKEDHLELWLAPSDLLSSQLICDSPAGPDPSRQWGIRISDGQVFPAFGAPEPLAGVEVVRSGHVARARIPVPGWLKGEGTASLLTVVYSDSDDGLRQKRLIATSQIVRGQVFSLGHVRDVAPAEANCVVKGKALQVNRSRVAFNPNQAMANP